ncbi:MAG TPA: phage tail sheath subtilisin-like domain-containing protein [Pyrinomonadaceae bacterium]|nr:phage tail sheath subtilisin-like domain-containing protein [Pyrinomonadaceae bacterium]
MFAYRTPGVYFEWLDTRVPALRPLRTDIAGFVGIAASGPLHTPVRLGSLTQFVSIFGGHIPQGFLAYAVEGFFANGGQTCWVVRITDPVAARAASAELLDSSGQPTIGLSAVSRIVADDGTQHVYPSPGVWGQRITFSLALNAPDRFTLTFRLGNASEIWRDLSMDANHPRYFVKLINGEPRPGEFFPPCRYRPAGENSGSRFVWCRDLDSSAKSPDNIPDPRASNLRGGVGRLQDGTDGLANLTLAHARGEGAPAGLKWGLAALEQIDEISIVAMPDIMPKRYVAPPIVKEPPIDCSALDAAPEPPPASGAPAEFAPNLAAEQIEILQAALVSHCERLKDRFAILDPRPADLTPEQAIDWRRKFAGEGMKYAAFYFPWLLVPDPLKLEGLLRAVPPSGHMAGIYARGDLRVGVHKSPANEEIEGAKDVSAPVGDVEHGELNEQSINVIREYRGRGLRVAGARTLSPEPLWRYINVRRLLTMIEETLDEQMNWTVFEPNNPDLWREADRVARTFLQDLWRRGLLDGATAAEAFFVRCDETTNPAAETEVGRMTCMIGVLPPYPAEFVVVRIGMTEGGTEISELAGGLNG